MSVNLLLTYLLTYLVTIKHTTSVRFLPPGGVAAATTRSLRRVQPERREHARRVACGVCEDGLRARVAWRVAYGVKRCLMDSSCVR